MVLQSFGQSTNFEVPISTKPSNSSVDAASHLSFSGEDITSWNMCTRISLMFPVEGPACGCHCSHAFVGQNEY